MKRLLWVGDAGCTSGFALATHKTLETLSKHYEVNVLGINYQGDPDIQAKYPYPLWCAAVGGDAFGVDRLIWMCDRTKPDVIVLQNDPWNIPRFLNELRKKRSDGSPAFPEYCDIPVVASLAIDGENCSGKELNGLAHAIFWTKFGMNEAREGGYTSPASVIPLGVDTSVFFPMDKYEARLRMLPKEYDDAFIVGNVNRNQPRKRWDLTIKFFSEWVYNGIPRVNRNLDNLAVKDARLYLHVAPTGDVGIKITQLARYYGVLELLILNEPPVFYGVSEETMRLTYNCFDVAVSTSQGEGFGLTALEAMACGVSTILPDNAAFGEWAKDAAWLVPCSSTVVGPPYVNVIGRVVDEAPFVTALRRLYSDREARKNNDRAALERAREPRFNWKRIGEAFLDVIDGVLETPEKVWEDLGRPEETKA